MKLTELINSNFSRKAEIVIATIAALVWVGTIQADEGKVIFPEIVKLALWGIIGVGSFGIFAQGVIDWKFGRDKENGESTTKDAKERKETE